MPAVAAAPDPSCPRLGRTLALHPARTSTSPLKPLPPHLAPRASLTLAFARASSSTTPAHTGVGPPLCCFSASQLDYPRPHWRWAAPALLLRHPARLPPPTLFSASQLDYPRPQWRWAARVLLLRQPARLPPPALALGRPCAASRPRQLSACCACVHLHCRCVTALPLPCRGFLALPACPPAITSFACSTAACVFIRHSSCRGRRRRCRCYPCCRCVVDSTVRPLSHASGPPPRPLCPLTSSSTLIGSRSAEDGGASRSREALMVLVTAAVVLVAVVVTVA